MTDRVSQTNLTDCHKFATLNLCFSVHNIYKHASAWTHTRMHTHTHTHTLSLFFREQQCILIIELIELQVILSVLYYHSTEQGMPIWDHASATGTPTECTLQEMFGCLFGILCVSWAFCSKPMQLTSERRIMNQNVCVSIKHNSSSVRKNSTHIIIYTLFRPEWIWGTRHNTNV